MYEEQYVPLDSIIFLAAEDFHINTQPWLCSLRHRISNIMTKYLERNYMIWVISSVMFTLKRYFKNWKPFLASTQNSCCASCVVSLLVCLHPFEWTVYLGNLRVVFLFTKITDPAITSLFTGPGRNLHQLIFLLFFFFIQHREPWILHDKLNFRHLCFLKVQSPLSSDLFHLAQWCCSLQGWLL